MVSGYGSCVELFNLFGVEFCERRGEDLVSFFPLHVEIQVSQNRLLRMFTFFQCIFLKSLSKIRQLCEVTSGSSVLVHSSVFEPEPGSSCSCDWSIV